MSVSLCSQWEGKYYSDQLIPLEPRLSCIIIMQTFAISLFIYFLVKFRTTNIALAEVVAGFLVLTA